MPISSLHNFLLCAAVVHILMTAVMAVFARHKIQYLSIAWFMGIFGVASACVVPFADAIESVRPAILHAGPLMGLMAVVFLQSIYPLGITMPGYLQWERMWSYALPAIVLMVLYPVLALLGMVTPNYYTWAELRGSLLTLDMLLRLGMLGVSVYYIINIFRLPHQLLRMPDVPHYLRGYATALGLSSCLYVWMIVQFSVPLFEVWLVFFTLINLYMCLRTLETIALSLPMPAIKRVEAEPVVETEQVQDDFNEANRQRFERIEFWMQNNTAAWKDYTFGRDQLCEGVGINRHLVLQALRSQGYNDVHEYISTYRVEELQRLIVQGRIKMLRESVDAGFGTIKTARSSFERIKGVNLDEFLASYNRKREGGMADS